MILKSLRDLEKIWPPPTQPRPDAPLRSQVQVTLAGFDFEAVELLVRANQQKQPFDVAVVDVQPGTEVVAEQIITGLYHTDPDLQILFLLAPGAEPGRSWAEALEQSHRMALLKAPYEELELRQWTKVLAVKGAGERQIENKGSAGHARPSSATPSSSVAAGSEARSVTLEAVGTLASGIAHEFNNVLTVIQNQMDLAMQHAASLPTVVELLSQVMDSARDATSLTRKLVSLSPMEPSKPAAVDLGQLVDEEIVLLKRMLGDHITVAADHALSLPQVWVDPACLSQVIVNAAVHAREAMSQGGTLQFSTREVKVEAGGKYARHFPMAEPGHYVMLTLEDPNPAELEMATVGDTDAVQRERLAWLQTTLSILGGDFHATAIPGMIRIYQMLLPVAAEPAATAADGSPAGIKPGHVGQTEAAGEAVPATILVVDDDETICMIMSQVLTTQNHRVLTARNADEGWQRWCQNRNTIKLLVTDINMPGGANGVALGEAIKSDDRSVPVIYTSGHRAAYQFTELNVGSNYLPKPFGMNDLLKVVQSNLAADQRHGLKPALGLK